MELVLQFLRINPKRVTLPRMEGFARGRVLRLFEKANPQILPLLKQPPKEPILFLPIRNILRNHNMRQLSKQKLKLIELQTLIVCRCPLKHVKDIHFGLLIQKPKVFEHVDQFGVVYRGGLVFDAVEGGLYSGYVVLFAVVVEEDTEVELSALGGIHVGVRTFWWG